MGIPAFYRWLVDRYPLSVVPVVEEFPKVVNGVLVPIDSSSPNPNGVEFDNLYLDMNGIIHPCFHPEDQPAPNSYEEVYKAVFKYIDHIFYMIRPRKLLYMAIDGVAPRAKMNQQRARRFRAAKDLADAAAEIEKLKDELGSEIEKLTQSKNTSKLDSNVITPGTEFMASLSVALQYYIYLRLNNDPGWRGIKVILSDANVPGEGEHKIASYIRVQRNLPGFDPNTRHCLYGLDADLIMLALATHELHFSILREDVRVARNHEKVKKIGISGKEERKELNWDVNNDMPIKKFQFLNIWVLREYLAHDLRISDAPLKIDLERLIDDFVFICLFVGNDFLPHVPSLEISEGAIDLLMMVYKKEFARMGGYLTNSFKVDLERVEHFLQIVGSHESAIFRRRSQVQKEREIQFGAISTMMGIEQNKASSLMRKSTNFFSKNLLSSKKSDFVIDDQVKLGEEGWKERYYAEKFEVKTDDNREKLKRHSVLKYVEGICWVMHYYYQGVCSWQWFYPYHYAPFASDFLDLKHLEIHFTLGVPFKPFDQLMGVLPAASAHALPLSYRNLMTDPSSAIIDFYPADFELDLNGKRFSWQAVCKLPFVEESRLLAELKKVEHTLTDEEKQRNSWKLDMLFVHISHPLASTIISVHSRKKDHPKLSKAKVKRKIDPEISGGMNGAMYISDKSVCSFEIYSPLGGMETITKNKTLFVYYKVPPIQEHIPRLPKGAILPKKSITKQDMQPAPVLWHERTALRRRIYFERPISNSIAGPHLSKMARQLVSNYYHEKKQRSDAHELDDHAMDDSCHRKQRNVEQKINHETNSKHSLLGKRKRRVRNDRSRKILGQNCEISFNNNSSLGKRKRRVRGRRRKKIAEQERTRNQEHKSNNSRSGKRKCKENSRRKKTAEEKNHGGNGNNGNIQENTKR
ncbi:LOW QUALITY PROTEIN: 5'-3' exoribonuclease 4 [Elaeis guineensis]|uniref:5'-3' exoribonuclease n=1 Tax=Elaeis guineensis var. tenera TaxID=51953 RepID=A0A6J0PI01_ELAGV|nr:LOW QUALITY PROTEIN: 5'-3' exoribonuclease 3 [Elaeis guineensis]